MVLTEKIYQKLIAFCRKNQHLPDSPFLHFSFILDGKKIISWGYNRGYQTHPIAAKHGHRFNSIHSELGAICKFPYHLRELRNYTFVNIRLNRSLEPALAAPCKFCAQLLEDLYVSDIFYSNNDGSFTTYYPVYALQQVI